MSKYKISYSLFHENADSHFSNCKSFVEANSFNEAVEKLKQEKIEQGWHVMFAVQDDMFEVIFTK